MAKPVRRRIVRAEVVEQIPHPIAGPSPFVVVQFESIDFRLMDRRRIKREQARAMRAWRNYKRQHGAA